MEDHWKVNAMKTRIKFHQQHPMHSNIPSWIAKRKKEKTLFIIDQILIRRHTHTRMLILSKSAHTPVVLFFPDL